MKLLQGTRADRINHLEPVPSGTVERPEWLSGQALVVWNRLAPDLEAAGVLTAWDVDHFAAYCRWAAIELEAMPILERDGALIQGERGTVKHPAMQVARDANARALAIGSRFGLTPSDRSKLSIDDDLPMRGEDLLN